jgi:steroid delta-isomerase-like uncharacterized protein
MAEQELIQIARGIVDAFNNGDVDAATSSLAANGVYNEIGTKRKLEGQAAVSEALRGWREAMPDVKGTVTNAFASGNSVVLEVRWEGTHTGPLQGPAGQIPASGKRQSTAAAWLFDFEGDRVKESRQYFDMMSFLQQIGAMP